MHSHLLMTDCHCRAQAIGYNPFWNFLIWNAVVEGVLILVWTWMIWALHIPLPNSPQNLNFFDFGFGYDNVWDSVGSGSSAALFLIRCQAHKLFISYFSFMGESSVDGLKSKITNINAYGRPFNPNVYDNCFISDLAICLWISSKSWKYLDEKETRQPTPIIGISRLTPGDTEYYRLQTKLIFLHLWFCSRGKGGGLCPGGFCPGGVFVWGVSVQRGLCPGGLCPEGVSVQGSLCLGGLCPGWSL